MAKKCEICHGNKLISECCKARASVHVKDMGACYQCRKNCKLTPCICTEEEAS